MATVVAPEKVAPKDFKPEVPPDWCPGCGDFGVLNALFQACAEIDLPPRDLLVVSGIGLNHFIQAMRRNINVTYIVMNNEIYGLTTGQVSPTSETGMKTKTTPLGNLEGMLNPLALALASGCGYVARGFSGQPKHLLKLYADAIRYPGFALIDVFS